MKTTLSMIALAMVLCSGCTSSSVADPADVSTSAKPTTRLYVRTEPSGAKIRLNGKEEEGESPQLFDVPAGATSMLVEVELDGHPAKRKTVVIEGGRIKRAEFKFDEKPQPAADLSARSIRERVMDPPKGWKVESSFIVSEDQMGAIRKKLGGRIKKLSNTIYSAHGQQVQVNLIECGTSADAEKIHKVVLAMKGDPAYALRFDKTIVEFVGTFDVAFAKRAARELGLIPSPVKPKRVHLPDADTPGARVVLDLASGEMFDVVRERDVPAQFKGLGKGDLFFDRVLGCLRGAQAMQWDGARFVPLPSADRQGDATAYELPAVPCRLLVTTAEKKHFDVTIGALSEDGGIDLEYREADPAVVPK